MREEIERCFQRLENLSTRELAHSAETVASREKRNVAVLIAHLAEISKRRVHLRLGYKSLFDYCVKHLRLSEGSAWSRIQVANPEVYNFRFSADKAFKEKLERLRAQLPVPALVGCAVLVGAASYCGFYWLAFRRDAQRVLGAFRSES